MGLTIHYSLAANRLTVSQARAAVAQLRQNALDLPFAEVSEIVELEDDACRRIPDEDNEIGWLKTQAVQYLTRPVPGGQAGFEVPHPH